MKLPQGVDQLRSGAFRARVQHRGEMISGTAPTLELAVALRDEFKRQIVDGELAPTKGMSAKDLGPKFLADRAGLRDVGNDESRWHRHVATAPWARLALSAVTAHDALAWTRTLKARRAVRTENANPRKRGGRHAAKLSWGTRKHVVTLARKFFEWAVLHQYTAHNPFSEVTVRREDGDEDGGYQREWYLDAKEQERLLATWLDSSLEFTHEQKLERFIAQVAMGTGLRERELWCLHLDDLHTDDDRPRIEVRFGSWDRVKKRYRAPKGRAGEKKPRTVPLFGVALEAARAWLAELGTYAPKNPLKLAFPTQRGARRERPPRTWDKVVEAFGTIPRIGRPIWWHLLRHTFGSSLVSGWWGMRWSLEDVQHVMGHTDVRTTQIYAHLSPSAVEATAAKAQAAFLGCHAVVTAPKAPRRGAAKSRAVPSTSTGYTLKDSNLRHSASKAGVSSSLAQETARHDSAVTAICHVLRLVASGELQVPRETVVGLEVALDLALGAYADSAASSSASSVSLPGSVSGSGRPSR
jgi:integrase